MNTRCDQKARLFVTFVAMRELGTPECLARSYPLSWRAMIVRTLFWIFAALLACPALLAHDVTWYENPEGDDTIFAPSMRIYYKEGVQPGLADVLYPYEFLVEPSWDEPCTVDVNIDPPTSEYLGADLFSFSPANVVEVAVWLKKLPPSTAPVYTGITGEWHATGFPGTGFPFYCDATNKQPFAVPVMIMPMPKMRTRLDYMLELLQIDTGTPVGLQRALALDGPWYTIGRGSNFTIEVDEPVRFFRSTVSLGGPLTGRVTDGSGNPLTVGSVGLPFGGVSANPDANGGFLLHGLSTGVNSILISKPITFTDPSTGTSRTENIGVDLLVPANRAPANLQAKGEMGAGPEGGGKPGCNCTPWCAIAVGTLNGAGTPVYYAGGALPPKNAPANCDQPVVTVTPPNGKSFVIKPGSARHQNSGPNPAAGTWTVTTTVCGQTKECSITVP